MASFITLRRAALAAVVLSGALLGACSSSSTTTAAPAPAPTMSAPAPAPAAPVVRG